MNAPFTLFCRCCDADVELEVIHYEPGSPASFRMSTGWDPPEPEYVEYEVTRRYCDCPDWGVGAEYTRESALQAAREEAEAARERAADYAYDSWRDREIDESW
jgi:hypothetical protein